ncbi:MAG: hypothetical protein H0W48_00235 [Methylibium sp.]|nr:hypothetical protein [Methylibium sp.]
MNRNTQLSYYGLRHPLPLAGQDVELDLATRYSYDGSSDWSNQVATFVVSTGACRVQTYLTPQALREVAAAMVVAAEVLEKRAAAKATEVEAA